MPPDAAPVADVLTLGWDQNAFNEALSPAAIAVEGVAGRWLKELFGLPATASAGFVTGGQGANTVGLAAARCRALRQVGWDIGRDGLLGAPRIRVLVGAERHATIDCAVRFLGIGERALEEVPALPNGATDVDALARALARDPGRPTIVRAVRQREHGRVRRPQGGGGRCSRRPLARPLRVRGGLGAARQLSSLLLLPKALGLRARPALRGASLARRSSAVSSTPTVIARHPSGHPGRRRSRARRRGLVRPGVRLGAARRGCGCRLSGDRCHRGDTGATGLPTLPPAGTRMSRRQFFSRRRSTGET